MEDTFWLWMAVAFAAALAAGFYGCILIMYRWKTGPDITVRAGQFVRLCEGEFRWVVVDGGYLAGGTDPNRRLTIDRLDIRDGSVLNSAESTARDVRREPPLPADPQQGM